MEDDKDEFGDKDKLLNDDGNANNSAMVKEPPQIQDVESDYTEVSHYIEDENGIV